MRKLACAALVFLIVGQAALASSGDYYTNSGGHHVHRPVRADRPPSGATAQCRDGTYSFSEHHRGTCSHHDGVERWLR
jgi:hypothetical protein